VQIGIEHEHGAGDGVDDASRAKDGRGVAFKVSRAECFDYAVDFLGFRAKYQFLAQLPNVSAGMAVRT
jgi:hypothetical protein